MESEYTFDAQGWVLRYGKHVEEHNFLDEEGRTWSINVEPGNPERYGDEPVWNWTVFRQNTHDWTTCQIVFNSLVPTRGPEPTLGQLRVELEERLAEIAAASAAFKLIDFNEERQNFLHSLRFQQAKEFAGDMPKDALTMLEVPKRDADV